MVQRVQMAMEPAIPSFICLRTRAKCLCSILIDLIPIWKSGKTYLACFDTLTDCLLACISSNGSLRTTGLAISSMIESYASCLLQDDPRLNSRLVLPFPRISKHALTSVATVSRSFCVYVVVFILFFTLELTPHHL
jgi:hypothetical protein